MAIIMMGVYLSVGLLAGGTANFLLFRRATAAIQLLTPREGDQAAKLALLRRVGGVSWTAVAIVFAVFFGLQFLGALAARR